MNVTPSFKKTTEKKSSFDALALREVYGIIYSAPEQELALADVFQTNQLTITRLSSSETFLPYLPLEENLFIASTIKERDRKVVLAEAFQVFQLEPALLGRSFTSFTSFTTFEKIKMRIIQLLLSKTSTLVIDDIFSSLTIGQRQEILPQLKIAVQKRNKRLLFLTKDPQIIDSPYVHPLSLHALLN